ncbi:MAG TPA: hypothetical protein VFB14_14060 [Bryobacteraceae bacterium]|jgi:hypothetical protein|nr:hypothetical protein [Bryobacteraceae bacterium]
MKSLFLLFLLSASALVAQTAANQTIIPATGSPVTATLMASDPSGACTASAEVYNYLTGHTWVCAGAPGAQAWKDGGGGSDCTATLTAGSNQIQGKLAANATVCVAGNQTQSSTVSITQSNVTLRCTNGAKITFATSSADGIDISGNDDRIEGCVLDGNSALAKPMLNISGNRATIRKNTFQNVGLTNPSTADLLVTQGSGHRIEDNYWPSIGDAVIYLQAASGQTISDVVIQNNLATFSPASGLYGFNMNDNNGAGTVARVSWLNNTMICSGSSGYCMAQRFNASPTGQGITSIGHIWRGNRVYLAGSVNHVFHWFGADQDDFDGNQAIIANTCSFCAASQIFSFGDVYYSHIVNNLINDQNGGSYGYFSIVDAAEDVVSGNVAYGCSNNGNNGCIYLTTAAGGPMSHMLIANNYLKPFAGLAVYGIHIQGNSTSYTRQDNQVIGNHIEGNGTAGSIGVYIDSVSGAVADTYVSGNFLQNLPTGVSVSSGSTNTQVDPNHYDTVTTPVSDSGTGTKAAVTSSTCTAWTNGVCTHS